MRAVPQRRRITGGRPFASGGGRFVAGGLLGLALLVVVAAGVLVATSSGGLSTDTQALARVNMPLGGGTIQSVSAFTGPQSRSIPVTLRGQEIWPRGLIRAHQQVTVQVVVKRPGSTGWLAGHTERLQLTLMTPSASLLDHYLTLRSGEPLVLRFKEPVEAISFASSGPLARRVLSTPLSEIRLRRPALAGTLSVAAVPRRWETSAPAVISWFPAGAAATAVASPAPGSKILPRTSITLTFSKPVSQVLRSLPPVSPATAGTWHAVNSHTTISVPHGWGYGLGASVGVGLPSGVQLVGGQGSSATWKVPGGSPLRLQQLLAGLGYLPLSFAGHHVSPSPAAQVDAAIHPPAGSFTWKYPNVPSALRSFWSPGASGVLTQGALMAFEDDHGMTTDGVAGPTVWRALINAAIAGKRSSFGYTFVTVDKGSQSLTLWHSGKTVITTPVNTGVDSAPTASGTFPVFEHLPVTTMTGTNPDGSQYSDPGIQWVSYFNGGDALHAFDRPSYGTPQSDGCVEMPLDAAAKVYPYTPIGTIVNVV